MQEQRPSSVQGGISQSDLSKTLVYKTASSPASTSDDLAHLKQLDKGAETSKQIWTGAIVVSVIVGIASFFLLNATQNAAFVAGIVLGFVGAVVGFVMRWKVGRLDLDDRRYTLVSELVRYLATDLRSDGLLDLTIDFNSYHNRRYKTGDAGGAASYELPWLMLKGTFADGNRFRLAVTQVVKRKERRKRKYTKVKESFREKIRLTIIASTKSYAGLDRMELLINGAKRPDGLQLRRVNCTGNRIDILAATECHTRVHGRNTMQSEKGDPSTSNHHTLLGLFLVCYHCLGQCRVQKKKGA